MKWEESGTDESYQEETKNRQMMKNESIEIWLEHETMVDISFLYLSVKSKIPLPGKD
jgi:hypothetical protein